MRKTFPPILIVVAVIAAGAAAFAFWKPPQPEGAETPAPSNKPVVAASVYPLYDITRSVAGDIVDVALILPPGSSPHAYEPRPSDIRKLDNANVAYVIGYGLDGWMDTLTESAGTPTVTVDEGIVIREGGHEEEGEHEDEGHDEEEAEHGHSHDEGDPHYWLSVANAKLMAENIAADLSARFPQHATDFAVNLANYQIDLDEADREMRWLLDGVTNRKIITMHDAWYYFAAEYELEVVGSFEPSAGREPTPQYLVELQKAVEEAGARTLYTEPLIAVTGIQSFVEDNGLTVSVLDPVEGAAGKDMRFIDVMIQNARTISENQ